MPTPYELATNPSQYTGLSWIQEGRAGSTRTGFLLHYLEPFITACAGKTVLDIGTGVGWLPASAMDAGAIRAVGIEPSADHVAQGRKDHPNV